MTSPTAHADAERVVGDGTIKPPLMQKDSAQFGPWTLTSITSHILKSSCQTPAVCDGVGEAGADRESYCTVCKYHRHLPLPQLPDMVFGDNLLEIRHELGFGIRFTPFDALTLVDLQPCQLKVAAHEAWRGARAQCEHIENTGAAYDWTYTTNYQGTLFGPDSRLIKVAATDERINIDKLKVQEQIYFYKHVHLFEDELADNGCSSLSAKVRLMADKFFILLRFYLRVDNQLIRVKDTRIYHEADKSYMLREFTSRESSYSQLTHVEASKLVNPDVIGDYLKVEEERFERLELPVTEASRT